MLGICIFLAVSIITALLDRHLSSILQYIFQAAAGAGLGEILLSQALSDSIRVWAGIVYLAFALSSLVAVNIRLAIVRRAMNIASIFSQMMTVPSVMISALFISTFLENGGELVFTPTSILTIAASVLVVNLSIFGLLREYSRPGRIGSQLVSFPVSPAAISTGNVEPGPELSRQSAQGFVPRPRSAKNEEWEEAPKKKGD